MRTAAFTSDLREPRKTINLAPEYSGAHQDLQVWGEFDLRAVLSTGGCVALRNVPSVVTRPESEPDPELGPDPGQQSS